MKETEEKETPLMKITAKAIAIIIILVVFLPALIRWLDRLLLPFVIIAVILLVARMVWFYTRA